MFPIDKAVEEPEPLYVVVSVNVETGKFVPIAPTEMVPVPDVMEKVKGDVETLSSVPLIATLPPLLAKLVLAPSKTGPINVIAPLAPLLVVIAAATFNEMLVLCAADKKLDRKLKGISNFLC